MAALKRWLVNIGLLVGTLVFCIAAAEIFLRVTGLQTVGPNAPKIYRASPDPHLSYELVPSAKVQAFRTTVTTNALGFRGPAVDASKPLVAFIGDSITFGYGVEDDQTFPARVQQALPQVSVLNAGVPGYDLEQEAETYKTKLAALHPSVLVHVFYFNDLTDPMAFLDPDGVLRPMGWTPQNDHCDPIYGILYYLPDQCWLDKHSAIYKAVKKVVNQRFGNDWVAQERTKSQLDPSYEPIAQKQVDAFLPQLDAFAAALPKGLQKLFVIWPDQDLHVDLRKTLRDRAAKDGYAVLDLYDVFGNKVPLLGWDQVHANADADVTAAKTIVDTLKKDGMVK